MALRRNAWSVPRKPPADRAELRRLLVNGGSNNRKFPKPDSLTRLRCCAHRERPRRVNPANEPEGAPPVAAMTATCRRTNSATSAGSRSYWPSAQRYSIATFSPSTKPASFRPWRNARSRSEIASGDLGSRYPITGIAACCALAASGHAATAPPSSVMNSRRFMGAPPQARAADYQLVQAGLVVAFGLMQHSPALRCDRVDRLGWVEQSPHYVSFIDQSVEAA